MWKHLPEVSVPELSKEVTNYPRDILVPGYFEIITYSKEDKKRSETYHSNIKRKELEKSSINLNGYLKSLNMEAKITPFKIERSTFHGDDVDYGGYNHKYDEPFTDRGGTDE